MSDSQSANFRGELYYVGGLGGLIGGPAVNGAEFTRIDGSRVPVGAGNRVKLYVDSTILRNLPGVSVPPNDPYPGLDHYGLLISFSFEGQDTTIAGSDSLIVRTPNYVREGSTVGIGGLPGLPTSHYMEATDHEVAAGSGDNNDYFYVQSFQKLWELARLRAFNSDPGDPFESPMQVLTFKAQGDFMRVFLFTDPTTFSFAGVDPTRSIALWALVGGDGQ